MKISRLTLILLILTLTLSRCINSNISDYDKNKKNISRNEAWIEDIDYLTKKLIDMHPNLFFKTTREEYQNKIGTLKKDIPKLNDDSINFRLNEIIASIGDAHTNYNPTVSKEQSMDEKSYPVKFEWFGEELRIIYASKEYQDLLGMKLIGINDIPLDDILNKISTAISFENREWLKYKASNDIRRESILNHLGISNKDKIVYNLEDDNKLKINKTIDAIKYSEIMNLKGLDLKDIYSNRKKPVKEDIPINSSNAYWYKFIKEDKIFYIQYNACLDYGNDSSLPKFDEFSNELIENLQGNIDNIDKVVVDVRNNTGGNSSFMTNLSLKIKDAIGTNKISTYTIANRGTFSSGVFAIADLKKNLNATIVGSETGGNVIQYGNLGYIESPNNKGVISYSMEKYDFKEYANLQGDGGVIPDIEIKESFESYKNGIDDCYEYIKNIQ